MEENVQYGVIHEQGDFGEEFNVTKLSDKDNEMLNKQSEETK